MSAIPVSAQLSPEQVAAPVSGASLKGKSALITGGASGLGAAVALAYAEKGAYVTIADINEKLGNEYTKSLQEKGLHVQFIAADVTSWESQIAAFKATVKFSPTHDAIDIVVASAGVAGDLWSDPKEPPFTLETNPPAPNISAFKINSIGLYYTAKLFELYSKLPRSVPAADPPVLILVASLVAYLDFPLMSSYTSSKYAARGLFRVIRPLLSAKGIRVNLIAPWIIETPLVTDLVKLFAAIGAPPGEVKQVVEAAMLFADDKTINGRAIATGPKRNLDLGDDVAGGDGGKVMAGFFETELPNWPTHSAGIAKLLGF
ncbi:NAD(P)-binding protein [Mytilinidion resinicola]|uniref:NAD(P)-binding protein n=1 Tax=Mytilinidion resinicola TaxID=574789 RepID=A0A6A6YTF5_9PEZI|nr:NAD(P)-binding protein [Mytilinidion resinicola]KAF2811245.1 NAD(P)-binding protein [Mytilinidion resinicola]